MEDLKLLNGPKSTRHQLLRKIAYPIAVTILLIIPLPGTAIFGVVFGYRNRQYLPKLLTIIVSWPMEKMKIRKREM